jgi:hypothetical protein
MIAKLFGRLGQKEQAMEWLEKAYEERSLVLDDLHADPDFDRLRSDARFVELMKRIGLPP